jgi:hypothetical protein
MMSDEFPFAYDYDSTDYDDADHFSEDYIGYIEAVEREQEWRNPQEAIIVEENDCDPNDPFFGF